MRAKAYMISIIQKEIFRLSIHYLFLPSLWHFRLAGSLSLIICIRALQWKIKLRLAAGVISVDALLTGGKK